MSDDNAPEEETPGTSPAIESRLKTRQQAARTAGRSADEPSRTGGSSLGVLAVFISLLATGIASWPAYELYRERGSAATEQQALDSRFKAAGLQPAANAEMLNMLSERLLLLENAADPNESIKALGQQVSEELDLIRSELGTRPKDWLFAEVEYLVRMANQRALMESDAASALTLLQAADQIVRDAEGLTAHGLRAALAGDIAALKSAEAPDVQGIYLELSALDNQVSLLKRSLPEFAAEEDAEVLAGPGGSALDRAAQVFREAGTRLSGLVDFRRGDVEIKPILPPEEAYYLRQNLALNLKMAQLALLEGNQVMFDQSLAAADAWVAEHFDADDGASRAMRNALQRLAGVQISYELPDISASLNEARALVSGGVVKP